MEGHQGPWMTRKPLSWNNLALVWALSVDMSQPWKMSKAALLFRAGAAGKQGSDLGLKLLS